MPLRKNQNQGLKHQNKILI